VLSISPIYEGNERRGVRYYLDKVGNSRDDYYTGRGEAPGVWAGRGAAALGLSGTVDADAYLAVMHGRSPSGPELLLKRPGKSPAVCGWSLTFSAPKSLSLLWAFGDRQLAETVRTAHDQAVIDTLSFLETEAARARRGHGGTILHDVDGVIGAAFRHRSSRAGDPQLHTHVIVANLVRSTEDKRWSGLDSRGLYDLVASGSAVYQSALRAALAPLGLRWAVRPCGLGEVADLDPRVLRAFSTQRRRIEAEMERTGHVSAAAAQVAAYRVRPSKEPELTGASDDGLRARWVDRLTEIRLGRRFARRTDVTRCLGRTRSGPTTDAEEARVISILAGATPAPENRPWPCQRLTERASTLTRAQVIRAVASAIDAEPRRVRQAVERLLARPEMVPLLAGPGMGSRPERRRYSTADLLEVEHELLASALRRQGEGCGRVSSPVATAVETAHADLGDDQRRVLRRLLASGDGIEVIVGPAGTGKTFLLAAARDAWQQAGYRVHGAALAALAAAQLQRGSGIAASTVHQLLDDVTRTESSGLTSQDIVVIDEAGMVGSRTLAGLAQMAEQAGAKLVFAGDHCQLPEIDAGGGFRLLAEALGAGQLTKNRRQVVGWERAALAELRAGSVPTALSAYAQHGRIWQADQVDAAREAIVDRWWALLNDGVNPSQLLIIAGTKDAVHSLGHAAQQRLRAAGCLGRPVGQTDHGPLHIGDRVLATRNDRRIGVRNGQRGTITSAKRSGELTVAFDDTKQEVDLSCSYVGHHLRQGYAITAHRAQGSTIDWALALVDDTWYRELCYSALSRARQSTELYLTGIEVDDSIDHHAAAPSPMPVSGLIQQLGRSRAEQAGITALPQLAELGDCAAARAIWDELDLVTGRLTKHQATHPAEPVDGIAARTQSEQDRQRLRDRNRLRQLEGRLQYRDRLLGVAVRYQRPGWATELLGPLPTSRTGEAAWLEAAGVAAAYIERWNLSEDPQAAAPFTDARDRHLRRVERALHQLQRRANGSPTSAGIWLGLEQEACEPRHRSDQAAQRLV
jgi:conjugative relaxase-like TrwC/TraI family protein